MIDTAVSAYGRLDIMVNNAGIETRTSVLDTTEDQYEKVLAINLKSAFFGTQLAAKQMIAQGGGGRIINMTSVHEDWPMPGNTAYCLSKGGMRMLTRTAGVELGPHNICVVGVGPGAVDTPINAQTVANPAALAELNRVDPARSRGRARGDRLGGGLPRRPRGRLHHGDDDLRRRGHHAERSRTLINGRRHGDRCRDLYRRSGAAAPNSSKAVGSPSAPPGRTGDACEYAMSADAVGARSGPALRDVVLRADLQAHVERIRSSAPAEGGVPVLAADHEDLRRCGGAGLRRVAARLRPRTGQAPRSGLDRRLGRRSTRRRLRPSGMARRWRKTL